jgi:hypothetical protein
MKMEINVNEVRVTFDLDTGAEVNIISQKTYNCIGAHTLSKCDEVARMYNGQTATFLGKGCAIFKRRNHMTTDVFYVAPRGSLNLLSYATMQRLEMYIADAEAVNAGSAPQPLALNVKTDTVASLKNSFPGIFKEGLGKCTVTRQHSSLKKRRLLYTAALDQCPTLLYRLWNKSLIGFSTWASLNLLNVQIGWPQL